MIIKMCYHKYANKQRESETTSWVHLSKWRLQMKATREEGNNERWNDSRMTLLKIEHAMSSDNVIVQTVLLAKHGTRLPRNSAAVERLFASGEKRNLCKSNLGLQFTGKCPWSRLMVIGDCAIHLNFLLIPTQHMHIRLPSFATERVCSFTSWRRSSFQWNVQIMCWINKNSGPYLQM